MRVYSDAPRREYEEVLRSIGSVLDGKHFRNILLVELDDGFVVRGVAAGEEAATSGWGSLTRTQLMFKDGDVQGELDNAYARRGSPHMSGQNERALRIVGQHIDRLKAADIMVTEQDGDWLLRCLEPGAERHQLIEFQSGDLVELTDNAVGDRRKPR